eukprot:15456530-Alexandrium_andersonii.AAC.1
MLLMPSALLLMLFLLLARVARVDLVSVTVARDVALVVIARADASLVVRLADCDRAVDVAYGAALVAMP